jgi:DNA-binding transcriptional MerR regulator
MDHYSVQKLASISGVSVRTLHYYDKVGLLTPSVRTEARYRRYGEHELLRLQQILFYKELDFTLEEIANILNDPGFDLVQALENHRTMLVSKQNRISTLLDTIDKTIQKLKSKAMLTNEELYAGFPREQGEAYRKEAIEKYGEQTILRSENKLRQLTKDEFKKLGEEQAAVAKKLRNLMHLPPEHNEVQEQVARHYSIIRVFWGTDGSSDTQAEAYKGLGSLYVADERFTAVDGKPDPEFAKFMNNAMCYFADTKLK